MNYYTLLYRAKRAWTEFLYYGWDVSNQGTSTCKVTVGINDESSTWVTVSTPGHPNQEFKVRDSWSAI